MPLPNSLTISSSTASPLMQGNSTSSSASLSSEPSRSNSEIEQSMTVLSSASSESIGGRLNSSLLRADSQLLSSQVSERTVYDSHDNENLEQLENGYGHDDVIEIASRTESQDESGEERRRRKQPRRLSPLNSSVHLHNAVSSPMTTAFPINCDTLSDMPDNMNLGVINVSDGEDEDGYLEVEIVSERTRDYSVASSSSHTNRSVHGALNSSANTTDANGARNNSRTGGTTGRNGVSEEDKHTGIEIMDNYHRKRRRTRMNSQMQAEISDDDSNSTVSIDESDVESVGSSPEQTSQVPVESSTKLGDFTCVICFDQPEIVGATPCGHLYCYNCMYRALASGSKATSASGECSVCRRRVSYKSLIMLEMKVE